MDDKVEVCVLRDLIVRDVVESHGSLGADLTEQDLVLLEALDEDGACNAELGSVTVGARLQFGSALPGMCRGAAARRSRPANSRHGDPW